MVIGLMGGVGSGKSTVADILKNEYGAHLLLTDDIAKDLYKKGKRCYEKIVKLFGVEILDSTGEIDRKKLASIVFADKNKLEQLDLIVHPLVMDEVIRRIEMIRKQESNPCIVIETALLISAGYRQLCDQVWYVSVDDIVRQKRLQESRGYSLEKIQAILNNQMSESEYSDNSDKILYNSTDMRFLIEQVRKCMSDI